MGMQTSVSFFFCEKTYFSLSLTGRFFVLILHQSQILAYSAFSPLSSLITLVYRFTSMTEWSSFWSNFNVNPNNIQDKKENPRCICSFIEFVWNFIGLHRKARIHGFNDEMTTVLSLQREISVYDLHSPLKLYIRVIIAHKFPTYQIRIKHSGGGFFQFLKLIRVPT